MLTLTVSLLVVCPFSLSLCADTSLRMSLKRTGAKLVEYAGSDAEDELEYSDERAMMRLDVDRALRSVDWAIEAD